MLLATGEEQREDCSEHPLVAAETHIPAQSWKGAFGIQTVPWVVLTGNIKVWRLCSIQRGRAMKFIRVKEAKKSSAHRS